MPLFTQDTVRNFEKLKGRSVQDLLHEHPTMAYDQELMIAASVLSGIWVEVHHIGASPRIGELISNGIAGHHEDRAMAQSMLLAAYIAVFEHQAKIHRRHNELVLQGHRREESPVATSGREFAIV